VSSTSCSAATEGRGWQREHMSRNRLAILPNITHYEMGSHRIGRRRPAVLNARPRQSWDEQVSVK